MRQAFFDTVYSMMKKDEKVFLVVGDLGVYTARHIFKDFPDRIVNIGICEQASVSVVAGMAIEGFKPIFYSIAPFAVERCLEQIKVDVGYQNLNVSIVGVGGSYDYAALGCTHHCPADVEIISSVPNMMIYVPGSRDEVNYLFSMNHGKVPLYMRLSEHPHDMPSFKSAVGDTAILAVGTMLPLAVEVSNALDIGIIYHNEFPMSRSLHYIDKLIIIEPFYEGTTRKFIHGVDKVLSVGVPRRFITKYGTKEELDEYCGLTFGRVINKVKYFINE